ncbi:hypothetical protein BT96DRAFT_228486 [Gymnopus androsaceus JB14]|uniref:Uncharacterized protein n=1 Tax=Gymnopus androsaceus JB14 TaxID=1447944 RepID=A0A6A4H541_9AGAR|nr:hypothetical protein BT96DRAFT_228486 [Gymnopus androsaceus JB14]
MSSVQVDTPTLCSRCQNPTFKPRIDLNSSEIYAKSLSEADSFALDIQEVNDFILLCDRDLGDYEVEETRLQAQLLFIREQQTRLRDLKTRFGSLTSPIRKIPNEILASVFDYACEWNLLQEFPWTLDSELRPTKLTSPIITYIPALSLSSTCTRWRSVAKSSPSLWSRFELEIASGEGIVNAFIAIVDLFLVRSNQHPLEIDLNIQGGPDNQRPPVLDLLLQHS